MAVLTQPHQGLNEIQLMLLKLFNRGMSEKEQKDIRDLILAYYEKELHEELESVIKQKGYTQKDFDAVLNNSQRTKRKTA